MAEFYEPAGGPAGSVRSEGIHSPSEYVSIDLFQIIFVLLVT
jgi:hypothetical protein